MVACLANVDPFREVLRGASGPASGFHQVRAAEHVAGGGEDRQTAQLAFELGIFERRAKVLDIGPGSFAKIGIHVGQALAIQGVHFRAEVDDVGAFAGSKEAAEGGVPTGPGAFGDLNGRAGVSGFESGIDLVFSQAMVSGV